MSEQFKDYYSTREAANLLGVAVSTIQVWSNSGLLSVWKTAGGHRRIACSSVNNILAKKVSISSNDEQKIQSPSIEFHQETLSVIIVEDNRQQIRLYKKQFAKMKINMSVTFAEDGYIGLMKIGSLMPDVIISDLIMPNIDGFKLINSLETIVELDNSLKIVVTGLTNDEVNMRGGLPEGVHLFTKPVPFEALETLIIKCSETLSQPEFQINYPSKRE